MKNKEVVIKSLLLIFTLTLGLTLGVYAIYILPTWVAVVFGVLSLTIQLLIVPIIKGANSSLKRVSPQTFDELGKIGMPKTEYIDGISYAEAFKWLRDKKGIYVYPFKGIIGFTYSVQHELIIQPKNDEFQRWEDMEEDALKSAIKISNSIK